MDRSVVTAIGMEGTAYKHAHTRMPVISSVFRTRKHHVDRYALASIRADKWPLSKRALLIVLYGFVSACSADVPKDPNIAPHAIEAHNKIRVDLTVWSAQYEAAFKKVAADYEKLHREVEVVIETVPSQFYLAWQQTQLVGGTAPAIMQSHWGNLWGKNGLIICWDDYLNRDNPYTGARWADLFYTENIDYLRDESGKAFMLPFDLVFTGIYYNKSLFKKLGVNTIPRTWSEWLRDMDTMRSAGIIPLAWPGAGGPQLQWIAKMLFDCLCRDKFAEINQRRTHPEIPYPLLSDPEYGYGEVLDGEENAVAFSNGILDPLKNPEFAEMARQFKRLVPYWQKGFNGADGGEVFTLFLTQRAATMLDGTWDLIPLQEAIAQLPPQDRFEIGLFRVPTLTKGDSPFIPGAFRDVGGPGGLKFIITKKMPPERVKWAVDFVQYLTSTDVAKYVFSHTKLMGPPNLKNVDPGELFAMFKGVPIVKMEGYAADEQSLDEVGAYFQLFFEDELTLDQLLERWHDSYRRGVERSKDEWGWDMNLATLEE